MGKKYLHGITEITTDLFSLKKILSSNLYEIKMDILK